MTAGLLFHTESAPIGWTIAGGVCRRRAWPSLPRQEPRVRGDVGVVVEALADDHVPDGERQRTVGTGVRTQVQIGVARRPAAVRIDDHEGGAVLLAGPADQ